MDPGGSCMCPDRVGGAAGAMQERAERAWRDPAPTEGPTIRPRVGGPPDRRLPAWNPPPGPGPRRPGRLLGSVPRAPRRRQAGGRVGAGTGRPPAGSCRPSRMTRGARPLGVLGRRVGLPAGLAGWTSAPARFARFAGTSTGLRFRFRHRCPRKAHGALGPAARPVPAPQAPRREGPRTAASCPEDEALTRCHRGNRARGPPASRSKRQRPQVAPGPSDSREG